METEIYYVEEDVHTSEEQADAALELIAELGLEGQINLMSKGATAVTVPYMRMNTALERIVETLCPETAKLSEYNHERLPLRILQEAAKCKEHGWFTEINVHYDQTSPDPFLVGIVKVKEPQSWDAEWMRTVGKYLIARWGDELRGFPELKAMATKRWCELKKSRIIERMAKDQLNLSIIDQLTDKHFRGEFVSLDGV